MSENKIKKAVIREDLLAITEDYREAIILNQFIYWSERVKDADLLIEKENEIAKNNGEEEREPLYGWIYKTADEMAEEIMLGLSSTQTRRYIINLKNKGFIQERRNPKYKWDRTLQYKVNLVNIARALKQKGYPLSDYKIELPEIEESTNIHPCTFSNSKVGIENSQENIQNDFSECALPEITNQELQYKNYNSENTKSENTEEEKKGRNNSENCKAETSVPEKQKHTHKKSKYETYLELKEKEKDMLNRAYNICRKDHSLSEDISLEVVKIIDYYLSKYTQKTGNIHPILGNEALSSIISVLYNAADMEYGHFENLVENDGYMDIIDEFFKTDFGQRTGERTDYHLSHFATEGVISRLAQRLV